MLVRALYECAQRMELGLRNKLPNFFIGMSGVHFDVFSYDFRGVEMRANPLVMTSDGVVHSCHLYGKRDKDFGKRAFEWRAFDSPLVIWHGQGHKPPSILSEADASSLD